METRDFSLAVHSAGEGFFEFETYGGKVRLETTEDALTPFGGLVPWSAFLRKTGVVNRLAGSCPVELRSANASSVYDILMSFLLVALCDGKRFSHVERLREDVTVCELLGMEKVVSDDTIRRFFKRIDSQAGKRWLDEAMMSLWGALPQELILDWDSTVQSKYGHQQGAAVGYNPHCPGRKSFHPLLAVAAKTRLCPVYRFRSGDTVSSSQWREAMHQAQSTLGTRKIWLNRGDIGFGNENIMAWHEKEKDRPHFLFKLKMTSNVRRAMAKIPDDAWQGPSQKGVLQTAETILQLNGWSCKRRVIFGRRFLGHIPKETSGQFWDQDRHECEAYVTNLNFPQANPWQIVDLYRQRADTENVFDELKNQWGFNGFCSRHRNTTELAARLLLLLYNLWNLFLRLMNPTRHIEAAHGRRWFLLIAGRLTKTSRQRHLQIAVHGTWWRELKDGYTRICQWLALTAPQLNFSAKKSIDFTFLAPTPT